MGGEQTGRFWGCLPLIWGTLQNMSFISYDFIFFVFILIFFYFILPLKIRCYVLLAGSLFFYYQAGWQGMVFLGTAALITYVSGLVIGTFRKSEQHKEGAFAVLILSLLFLISMLLYAKLGDRLLDTFDRIFAGEGITLSTIVPLGISYYSFAAVGYLADVYWKKDQPEYNPFKLVLYLCYFPQILQGPIPKHKKLAPRLSEGHRFDYDRVCFGLQRAVWGFFKKLVIADRLAIMVNEVFQNYLPLSTAPWLMSVGKFFRSHVSKSAGRNIVTTIPLIVVWILTGLWHGTGLDYLVWGLYWGGIIILSTWLAPVYRKVNKRLGLTDDLKWWRVVRQLRTFGIYTVGRLLTLPGNLSTSRWIAGKIFTYNPWVLSDGTLLRLGWDEKDACVAIIALLILWRVSVLQEKGVQIRQSVARWILPVRWAFYLGAIFAVLIFGVYGTGFVSSTFVYMNY